ncbi:SLC13 family permease [Corallococcus praedator]|uniref:SLC13 family permease n=1 Tax=Corallococcus praedator TaxID=2316724 RepID=A0ABX9QQH2_9BACT|nr:MULTISPECIES: SLC13 family permease [Corallococcus]RKH20745.1 SLC13 family permease [Corallococcus sp. CA047B]RKH33344.1 SLC13 family permease [Corallococcus sp. CA031C]RKI16221.1 SLC13 family permease [Corallococcus praedator]
MTVTIALVVVVIAIVLLSIDRIPTEVSSLAIVVLLVLSGLLTPREALSGFSNETVVFIFALLALTQGLSATGVMQLVGRRLLFFARFSTRAFIVMLLAAVCAFSSVASNTAVTAAFLPVATASSAQAKVASRRLLMPLAFTSMLGGTIFLFGTSTNLVVSSALEQRGLGRIGFTELTPVGLPLAIIGISVTLLLMRWLLPPREGDPVAGAPPLREYVTEAVLTPGSRLVGKPLRQLTEGLGVPVRGVVREGIMRPPAPQELMEPQEHLIIAGSLDDILRVKDLRSIGLSADLRIPEDSRQAHALTEVSVPPTSALAGRSLGDIRFAQRYGLVALAIHRHPTLQGSHQHLNLMGSLAGGDALKNIPLSVGDLLLVGGPEQRVRELAREEELTVLGGVDYQRPRYRRALLAVLIFATTVAVAGLRVTSPAIAGLAGLLLMVATGCVDTRTVFRVDWRVIIMIGALLALGLAVEKSGAGEFMARAVLPLAGVVGPRGVLCVIMSATVLLSIPMSNQAAALVMLPVAIHSAMDMGLDPRAFALGTCLAASCSFLTPLEPSAALVYGPGRYRFVDFLRVGTPLTVLMLVLLTFAVPLVWPFTRG